MNKTQKIEKFLKEPVKVGDSIYVQGLGSQDKKSWFGTAKVTNVIDGIPYIEEYSRERKVTEEWKKSTSHIGNDPFPKVKDNVRSISFQLESVLFSLFKEDKYDIEGTPIASSNFNPFVFVNGKKKYYQRPLVWELKDKQLLLESIYNGVDCGKILVRNRSWEELRTLQKGGHELAWKDVVDGKQRVSTINEFLNNGFKDMHGNFYDDLTENAQRRLTGHQLISYSELPENTKDEEVLRQFLRLNFAGVPQSESHIQFVKSLL